MRLQKYMAQCNVASRRKCEEIISQGSVKVNGETIKTMGYIVEDTNDIVSVNGKIITLGTPKYYYAFNKPTSVIASSQDTHERKTVMDYFDQVDARLFSVGRLDFHSEGLLLVTNDGDFANKVTHPKYECEKEYEIIARGMITPSHIKSLERGVMIDDARTGQAHIRVTKQHSDITNMNIIIREGRNRQVRKMLESINSKVVYLKRVRVGIVQLGELKKGKYRSLTKNEIDYFFNLK